MQVEKIQLAQKDSCYNFLQKTTHLYFALWYATANKAVCSRRILAESIHSFTRKIGSSCIIAICYFSGFCDNATASDFSCDCISIKL
jgi:hypothetical protein